MSCGIRNNGRKLTKCAGLAHKNGIATLIPHVLGIYNGQTKGQQRHPSSIVPSFIARNNLSGRDLTCIPTTASQPSLQKTAPCSTAPHRAPWCLSSPTCQWWWSPEMSRVLNNPPKRHMQQWIKYRYELRRLPRVYNKRIQPKIKAKQDSTRASWTFHRRKAYRAGLIAEMWEVCFECFFLKCCEENGNNHSVCWWEFLFGRCSPLSATPNVATSPKFSIDDTRNHMSWGLAHIFLRGLQVAKDRPNRLQCKRKNYALLLWDLYKWEKDLSFLCLQNMSSVWLSDHFCELKHLLLIYTSNQKYLMIFISCKISRAQMTSIFED